MSQRNLIVGITAFAALWMYIDRVCFSTLATDIGQDLGMTDRGKAAILGAFFLSYAMFQIPIGTLADRYGPRRVLSISIAAWSTITMLTGFASSVASLLVLRLLLGISESGAYPAAAGLIKNWAKPEERGRYSSIVSLGGRIGGALAPALTVAVAAGLAGLVILGGDNPSQVNWRGVFLVYGICGLLVALVFWLVVRDFPQETPQPPGAQLSFWREISPIVRNILRLAGSRTMWLYGFVQLGVSIGWSFLITLLPDYLSERFQVSLGERGDMQSAILATGCVGMVVGGLTTDWFRVRFGLRWGRAIPLSATAFASALIFFVAPALNQAWAVAALLATMAFLVDMSIPCIWAVAQDVGGRKVGAALGWGNMWGNLAAWQSPILITEIKRRAGWDAAFAVCGGFFIIAAMCGMLVDTTRSIDPKDSPLSP